MGSGSTLSLPNDVIQQRSRRMFTVGVTFAFLWTVPLFLHTVVRPRVGGMVSMMEQMWPIPGVPIAVTGILTALLLTVLARAFGGRPDLLQFVGSCFLVINSLLFGLLDFWIRDFAGSRHLLIAVCILAYSPIASNKPSSTLAQGLLAATMAPLALIIARLRGISSDATWYQYLIAFFPNYLAALVAVVPSRIIHHLGHEVKRARELGSYRLDELLGKGGMGEVYSASHQMLARPAAVKLIRPEILSEREPENAEVMIERFRREAEAAATLRSPHTISLYDFGASGDGIFFFVMELLDGLDLESLVQRFGPLPPERAVYLLKQACDSLAEAHARGLIHRDVKPSNIFTCRMGLATDFVKVLDFGLVKDQQQGKQDLKLTAPEAPAGTPAYMAPESVLASGPLDHRIDIYALGCVAYWLVTGQLVFEGENPIQLLVRHAHHAPQPPSYRTELPIPPALDQVILDCLAKRPEDRPQSAMELARRLELAVHDLAAWDGDRADRWWQQHRPESARPLASSCTMHLSKTMIETQTGQPIRRLSGVAQ